MASPHETKYALTATRRNRLRRAILEMLEPRQLMAADSNTAIFAPGTSDSYIQQWNADWKSSLNRLGLLNSGNGGSGGTTSNFEYLTGARWTDPVGGKSPNIGDPATVTWSIVPDGTLNTRDNLSSNLVAFMDNLYGSAPGPIAQRPWFNLFQRVYDAWGARTGLTFVYEPADDGTPIGLNNRGVRNIRGDMRIGGNRIDGNSNVLAYNFLPVGGGNSGFDGDMIIDTADNFYANNSNGASGENRGLINVLSHEVGHGIGLLHVNPVNATKLMEPFVNFAFLGTQHDDVLGAQELYGDDKEANNLMGSATDLGSLDNGTTGFTNLSTQGATDQDWFTFKIPSAARLSVSARPTGQSYIVGPDGGPTAPVDTLRNADLVVQVVASDGTVLTTLNSAGVGLTETLSNYQLPTGGQYFVRITGLHTKADPQMYDLTLTIAGVTSGTSVVNAPRLLSVAPNSGQIFNVNSVNTLNVSPTELVFRFDGASDIDPATLARGIRITRAGKDGLFGQSNDQIVVPGYVGFGDNNRIVVLRFAAPLVDDLYRIEVMGADIPAQNLTAIKGTNGIALQPRVAGTDRDVVQFKLELGAQIIAVVPQPVSRNSSGVNVQARNQIQVFFNDDDLYPTNVKTGDVSPNPTVVDPSFYQLFADRGTVSNVDDISYSNRITQVEYFPGRNLAVLTFDTDIDLLDPTNDTQFRLRIGTDETRPSTPITPVITDPASTFANANLSLGTLGALSSYSLNDSITNTALFPLDYPGAPDMPGVREINPERKYLSDAPDSSVGIPVQFYNFNKTVPYGRNTLGQQVFNGITEQQKQRAREVFEFYGSMLGVKFIETEDFNNNSWTIVTGDLSVFGSEGGQGGTLGIAGFAPDNAPVVNFTTFGRRTVVLDASENWNNEFGASDNPSKPSWFTVAMHEIGHLLGFGHASEQPPGTNMAGLYANSTLGGVPNYLGISNNPVEPVFPGSVSEVSGQYLFRPDSRDIDMYRFVVENGKPGLLSAEVIAERKLDSSSLDSFLTLYREVNGVREVVAVNDNYFSKDSFMQLELEPGIYYLGVTASGNSSYDPNITDSGMGGVSEGNYELRVSFRPIATGGGVGVAKPMLDMAGSPLDGDGDGVAGGVFNFWFNAAAPVDLATTQRRTLFVDKAPASNLAKPLGSLENPFSTIQAAFAAALPGDIVRVLPNGGVDGVASTQNDNFAFEIGRGGLGNAVLSDGENMDVPKGVTVIIDAGVLFKVGASSIGVGSSTSSTDRSKASLQVLGTPESSVIFTSYNDETLGVDTSSLPTVARAGDWGGIIFRNAIDRGEGRFDDELNGRFMNHVAFADMRYGGGRVTVDGQPTVISPISMVAARPTLTYNRITLSADAAMSADPDSFEESTFNTARYQRNGLFTPDYDRVGPEIHGNTTLSNSVNGLFVRVDTTPGQPAKKLTVSGRWDDTDIVHVVSDVLAIEATPGGAFRESVAPSLSVVGVSAQSVASGALTAGSYSYRMTFVDSNGNESVASLPTTAVVVSAPNNAIQLQNLPSASSGFVARRLYRSLNGGTFFLVAEIDRSSATYVDSRAAQATALNTAAAINRARLDASLVIDPGAIIKLSGGQFITGIGSQLVAEGTADLPIIFTSRKDDRFGAGGTFDTNNDASATVPVPGDWGGLYFGQTGQGSIANARITFGGGIVSVGGTFAGFNPVEIHQAKVRVADSVIESNETGTGGQAGVNRVGYGFNEPAAVFIRGSEPIVVNNTVQNNLAPAFSINAAAMSGNTVLDQGRARGDADRLSNITENKGPLFRGNKMGGNTANGLVIRGEVIDTESVWDDTDIVHVVFDEIIVPDLYVFGGLRLQSSPTESLVVKFGPSAGLTSTGRPLDIDDRIGGTIQVVGTPGFPVVMTSVKDDTIGAGYNPLGGAQLDTTSDGTGSTPSRGDWRSIRLESFSNDRNVEILTELEPAQSTGAGVNGTPGVSQSLGELAANEKAGDDRIRLGMTVVGAINNIDDVDVYSFTGTAGTQVWLDIDRTDIRLDTIVELVDSSGTIIAQSDDSLAESQGTLARFTNGALIAANRVNSLPQDLYAPRNNGTDLNYVNSFSDFYSTNPRDAGMRLVLPGAAGSKNTYFVRVRSSNIDFGGNRADLQNNSLVNRGKTEGQYQLQVRLREMDEVAGSTVRYADIRYAITGVELLGLPGHSPVLGEAVEPTTNNDVIANALNLGNFANTDRAALSIAGELTTAADVDWYRFDINQDVIQSDGLADHLSTIIDVDYADGFGRPNSSLWLFYQNPANGTISLVNFGTDSNIADDVGAPLKGSNADDLSRGSGGLLDAFIGTQELPSGTYFLAITGNQLVSSYMDQFYRRDAGGNPLVRAEPIDSVQRLVEDRFDNGAVTTANGASQVAFTGVANQVPITLGEVPLYVLASGGTELHSVNTMTGAITGLYSRFTGNPMQDLAMRSDGTLYGSFVPNGAQTDANTGAIFTIDEATGTITQAGTSGIQTYEVDTTANPPAAAQAQNSNGNRVGKGMNFYGLTYPQEGAIGELFLYGVGSRGDGNPTQYRSFTATNFADARNYVYKLNATTLAATSAPQGDRQNNALATGGGTQIVERGYIDTSRDVNRNATAQTILMGNATQAGIPSLLPGDKVTLQTPTGPVTFEWSTTTLSTTLIADTQPQRITATPAPTNFYRDGEHFTVTGPGGTRTFEIDTGRVLNNVYNIGNNIEGATLTVTIGATTTTFEFDSNNAITAGNTAIAFTATTTRAQLSALVIAAINAMAAPTAQTRAFLVPGTDRISVTGDTALVLSAETPTLRNPFVIDKSFVNVFGTAPVGKTYDGATFTVQDANRNTIVFELDNNNSITAGRSRVPFINGMTRAQITTLLVNSINNPDPVVEAALPGGVFIATAAAWQNSDLISLTNILTTSVGADTALIENPVRDGGEYGVSITGAIRVPVEEYFTNLDDNQVAPTPSTPGAMDEFVLAVNNAAFGVTATAISNRLVLTGATTGTFNEIPPMVFNASGTPGTIPINFGFNDTSAVLNNRLLNAINNLGVGAVLMNDGRVRVPESSFFVQATTDDRLDTPPKNAQLSAPVYGFVTGLTMISNNQMYAVSENGDLYRVGAGATFNLNSAANAGDYIETIYNPITRNRVNFVGLTTGPYNAENGALRNVLFGIDSAGVLYAFDTAGKPAFVFDDAQWFIQTGVSNPTGLAFSNLDTNLWHLTQQRGNDAGHGVEVSPDGVRITRTQGQNSLYFGLENPNNPSTQTGNYAGLRNPTAVPNSNFAGFNTYDFSGARGSAISAPVDLSGYSPGDKPTLYFNYYLVTENANANIPGNNTFMKDSLRVYVSGDDGEWKLLASNNSDFDNDRFNGNDEFDYTLRGDNAAYQMNELYDAGAAFGGQTAPNSWRQARLDLSPFAGQKLVRVRYEFDTGANSNSAPATAATISAAARPSGAIELSAVPGTMIAPGNTFTITNFASGAAVTTTFEFDFGVLLDIPSGANIANNSTFDVAGTTYTFVTGVPAANQIQFAATDTAAAIAVRVRNALLLNGLTPNIDPARPGFVSVIDATTASAPGQIPGFVADVGGVAFGNRPVLIHKAMTYAQVRDAIRTSLAAAWNTNGQVTSTSTIKFFDRTIYLWNKDIVDAGPLGFNEFMGGDDFGVVDSTNLGGPAIQRNTANNFEGVYIDDIVIGFAERGEMITGTGTGTGFSPNPFHEPDPTIQETELGTYQIEVRRAASYGANSTPFPALALQPAGLVGRTFDTNDRLAQEVSLIAPAGAALFDGQTFTLSDGVDTVTFEFDDVNGNTPVAQGNVRIPFDTTDDADTVARAIRDAINSSAAQAVLGITAAMSDGTAVGTGFVTRGVTAPTTSRVVNLHGTVSSNNFGAAAFFGTSQTTATGQSNINTSAQASTIGFILHGKDSYAKDDLGDSNRFRDQGQVIIQGNIIRDTSGYGIVVDAGSRTSPVLTPLAGALPHPGAAANLFQFNQAELAPGATITNNLIYGSGTGGILFSGDTQTANTATGAVPFGRLVNNTIVGTGAGIGINVTDNASPTLLNNIVSSLSVGVQVDVSSTSTVLGGMVFQNNGANIGGSLASVGSFAQVLTPAQPLFVNPSRRNYYLASGSLAIDSSVDSLADRPNMTTVRQPLGIADSPIVAPDVDVTGQLRVDDPLVNTPVGLGGNVFKDRGAIDRSDFSGPIAVIQTPLDNDPDFVDVDRNSTFMRLTSGSLDSFSILLLETQGTGPDATTVTSSTVVLTENGRLLKAGIDYGFGYNANSRTIRLTPIAGIWRSDSVYEISLQNRDGFRVVVGAASGFADGDRINVTLAAGGTRTFEFDSTPAGVSSGAIAVPITTGYSAYQMAAQLVAKINSAGGGLSAYIEADGSLMILGASAATLTTASATAPLTIAAVGAIRDVATNPLQANRATSSTQFTIVMPDVQLDYGDARGTNSVTTQVSNGARHAILPRDAAQLALGQIVDADADGVVSPSATADDSDAQVQLVTAILAANTRQGTGGPASFIMPAANVPGLDGQKIIVTDPFLESVTFEFDTNGSVSAGAVAIAVVPATDDAVAVASKFEVAVNNAVRAGRVEGIIAVANGSTVSMGGSAKHVFNNAAASVQRLMVGNVELNFAGIDLIAPSKAILDAEVLRIIDGNGTVVNFEINNSAGVVTPVASGNVEVRVDLTTVTSATLAQAFATAINNQILAGRLNLGLTGVDGSIITIRGNDEDGVTFGGLFNARSLPVPISVTATGAGMLDAWIDWNGDGDFADTGEQFVVSQPVQAGINNFPVQTPLSARVGITSARFRISAVGSLLTGGAAVGGEVEDYVIEIVGGNPPVAVTDGVSPVYSVGEDSGSLTIAAPGILANDTDADGDALVVFDGDVTTSDPDPSKWVVEPLVGPANAKFFRLYRDGHFDYTPRDEFSGQDTFVYYVADSRLRSVLPATVTINVTPVNDAPKAFDDRSTTAEDTKLVLNVSTGILANDWKHFNNDRSEDGQTLNVVSASIISPVGGTLTPILDANNNIVTLEYTPPADYNDKFGQNGATEDPLKDTPALILITIEDSGTDVPLADRKRSTSTLTVSVTPVNDKPSFTVSATEITVNEDNETVTGVTPTRFTGFATGVAGPATALDEVNLTATKQSLTYSRVSLTNSTLFSTPPTLLADGTLEFATAPEKNGQSVVVFRLQDSGYPNGQNIETALLDRTVTINVTAVNDPPVFGFTPVVNNIREDQGQVSIPLFLTNLAAGPALATDESTQTLTITVTPNQPSAFRPGSLSIAADGTLQFETAKDVNSLTHDLTVTVTVTDSVAVAPAPNKNFTTAVFTISVAPVNDAPLFTLDQTTVTVTEDNEQVLGVPLSSTKIASGIAAGPSTAIDELSPAATAQDFDFEVVSNTATNLFSVQPQIADDGTLTFKTFPNQNGKAVIVTRLVDKGASSPAPNVNTSGNQTFTISITAVNDAPEFTVPAGLTVNEGQGLVTRSGFASGVRRGPLGADDENAQEINFVVEPVTPGAFDVAPSILADGTLSFQTKPYLNSVNTDFTVRVYLRDNGAATPAPNSNQSAVQTFSITVAPVNDPPITDAYSITGTEDKNLTIVSLNVLVGDLPGPTIDEMGQFLKITQVERTTLKGGTITPEFSGPEITRMVYTPPANLVGTDSFLYVVTDDGVPARSGTGTITITLTGENDAPVFFKGADQVVLEDAAPVSVPNWATGIAAGPASALDELASQTVSFTVTNDKPSLFSAAPAVSDSGTLTFTPAKDANGTAVVTVFAKDSGSGVAPNVNTSAPQTFTITINPVNDAPTFVPGPNVAVDEDAPAVSQAWATAIAPAAGLLANPQTAEDEVSQQVEFIVTSNRPELFSVAPAVSPSGLLTFTPARDAFGIAVLTVVARDRGPAGPNDVNSSAARTVTVTINQVNDAPVAVPDSYQTNENVVFNLSAPGLLANDTDVDLPADQLSVVPATLTSSLGASVVIRADGTISYDPRSVEAIQKLTTGQTLTDTFTYRVEDLAPSRSGLASVTILINGVDDAPIAVNDTFTIPVGQTLLLDVLANDSDLDTRIDPSSIVVTAQPTFGSVVVNATGVVSYTPGIGFRGVDSFGYTIRDVAGNISNEAVVTLIVNNPPQAANDSAVTVKGSPVTVSVLSNDIDPDGSIDPATVEVVAAPAVGTTTVLANGQITFTPPAAFSGQAQFSYFVRDNSGSPSNVATVTVDVLRSKWQNPTLRFDVNADTFISPIDALLIINFLNRNGSVSLPSTNLVPPPYYDVNGDESVSTIDALQVINYLNGRGSSEGEGESSEELPSYVSQGYVTMVTPEQMLATVVSILEDEIRSALDSELGNDVPEACNAWDSDDEVVELITDRAPANWDSDEATDIDSLLKNRNRSKRFGAVDDFFGSL